MALINRLNQSAMLFLVLLQFLVVVLRYGFDMGFVALDEVVVMLYGWIILMGIAHTLTQDGHVRLDIFYQAYDEKTKKRLLIFGTILFLWPMMAVMIWTSMPYVFSSWVILEQSRETSGLPVVYLYKTLLILSPVTVFFASIHSLWQAIKK